MTDGIRRLREEIFAVVVIFFSLIMVYASIEISQASNTDNTELYQNLTAGTLDIAITNTNVSFSDAVAGSAANSLVNLNDVKVTDYRGTLTGWTAATAGAIDNFVELSTPAQQITLTDSLRWSPGDITALNGASNTGVTAGTDDAYLDGVETLIQATAGNGGGAYQIDSTLLNFEVEAGYQAGNYSTTLELTVS